jgi:hypothetical protein
MTRLSYAIAAGVLAATCLGVVAYAQQPAPPPFATTKVDGVKAEAQAGKCWDGVEKELKLPKYQSWPGYEQNLPFVLRRYCGLWGRGF